MKKILMAILLSMLMLPAANAVPPAQDLATTIKLRGHACGGSAVSQISEVQHAQGHRVIRATCPNGVRYQIVVTANGRIRVKAL